MLPDTGATATEKQAAAIMGRVHTEDTPESILTDGKTIQKGHFSALWAGRTDRVCGE